MFNINADLGTSEVVEALVHQRIISLNAELTAKRAKENVLMHEVEEHRCEISYCLRSTPPDQVADFVRSVEATGLFDVWALWSESKPCSEALCHFQIDIEPISTMHSRNHAFRAMGKTTIQLEKTDIPPAGVPIALMDEFDRTINAYRECAREVCTIEAMLNDRNLRQNLRGDMLTKVIERQAPEMAQMIGELAGARKPLAITVQSS